MLFGYSKACGVYIVEGPWILVEAQIHLSSLLLAYVSLQFYNSVPEFWSFVM